LLKIPPFGLSPQGRRPKAGREDLSCPSVLHFVPRLSVEGRPQGRRKGLILKERIPLRGEVSEPFCGELTEPFHGEHVEPRFILGGRPVWESLGFLGEKNFFKTLDRAGVEPLPEQDLSKTISFLKVCPYARPYGWGHVYGWTDKPKQSWLMVHSQNQEPIAKNNFSKLSKMMSKVEPYTLNSKLFSRR